MRALMPVFIAMLVSVAAYAADRPVNDGEKMKLEAALKVEGCSGGKLEFDIDDNKFEVDDAVCADGKKYDIDFDTNFKLIRKKPD